ncbi:hypothetical protein F5Y18DRAFT_427271 [Xylariaceae sp. FL1019]|nr:hypothetical protein F5Y18DRAFT_427271 [Xylariaceae sp. FL1019]
MPPSPKSLHHGCDRKPPYQAHICPNLSQSGWPVGSIPASTLARFWPSVSTLQPSSPSPVVQQVQPTWYLQYSTAAPSRAPERGSRTALKPAPVQSQWPPPSALAGWGFAADACRASHWEIGIGHLVRVERVSCQKTAPPAQPGWAVSTSNPPSPYQDSRRRPPSTIQRPTDDRDEPAPLQLPSSSPPPSPALTLRTVGPVDPSCQQDQRPLPHRARRRISPPGPGIESGTVVQHYHGPPSPPRMSAHLCASSLHANRPSDISRSAATSSTSSDSSILSVVLLDHFP